MRSTAQTAAAIGQNDRHVEFQVSRNADAFRTIRPVSDKAKGVSVAEFGLDSRSAHDLGIVAKYFGSNAKVQGRRSRGFSILCHGPAGPITL
jgi:hypothetical protein